MWSCNVITPPASEPVTLDELKYHCDAVGCDDPTSAYLTALGVKARQYAEVQQNRKLLPQTLLYTADYFPCGPVLLPYPKLISLDFVKYLPVTSGPIDADSPLTPMVEWVDYYVDYFSTPARIVPAYGKPWPIVYPYYPGAVQIQYVTGYADADHVPETTKHAIELLVYHWFEIRQPIAIGTIATDIKFTVDSLLQADAFPGIE